MKTLRFKVVGRTGSWRIIGREVRTLLVENTSTLERALIFAHQIIWSRRV